MTVWLLKVWARLATAGAWLKKNWKWLLAPIGVLLWLLGRASKKTVIQVESPALEGHAEVDAQLEAAAAQRRKDAQVQLDQQIAEVAKRNQVELQRISEESAAKQRQLQQNPDEIAPFLLDVGKSMQSEKKSG